MTKFMVNQSAYESAVRGRSDFRAAFVRVRETSPRKVHLALLNAVKQAGSYSELGRLVGISDEYVRNMVLEKRPIRGKMLKHLGFEAVTVYRTINGEN